MVGQAPAGQALAAQAMAVQQAAQVLAQALKVQALAVRALVAQAPGPFQVLAAARELAKAPSLVSPAELPLALPELALPPGA